LRGQTAKDNDLSIYHFRKAAELAPIPKVDIWSHLGLLYMVRKDYAEAEKAYKKALTIVTEKSGSRPRDFLSRHNELSGFYRSAGNTERRKHHLEKAIEYNRLFYKRDSVQEGGCWNQLAQIVFKEGNFEAAIKMQIKAINNYEGDLLFKKPHLSTLDRMKEQLEKWKAKQKNALDKN